MRLLIAISLIINVSGLGLNDINLAVDYFLYRNVKFVTYFSCDVQNRNYLIAKHLVKRNVMTSVVQIGREGDEFAERLANEKLWGADVGMLLEGSCDEAEFVLSEASQARIFDAERIWLILTKDNDTVQFIQNTFGNLNLSIDANVAVASGSGENYSLTDVFNFGRIQGNGLEMTPLGSWCAYAGLHIVLTDYKYSRRSDFHNLTLRAVTVVDELAAGVQFRPALLAASEYTRGINAITKVGSQLLNLIRDSHNFRLNYTVTGRWIGSPIRNSTLAVTNTIFWEEADVSSTSARMVKLWLNWVDVCFPPAHHQETKFYYLIPDKGVGDYENRFITPLSDGVWWCILAASGACAAALTVAACLESRQRPATYAFFSVTAAICQQDFEEGAPENMQSQGRRMAMLVVGLLSMLLYNYYTSSVVSWLLNASSPSIANLEGLIASDFEIIFEDIGYTRSWLDRHLAGMYYYSGFTNPVEDRLRDKKVTFAKRKVDALQQVEEGVRLIQTGGYAFHMEPYTARQVIAPSFSDAQMCGLGQLQMMRPFHTYIYVQRRSPYRQFFVWSLTRLLERGLSGASRARFSSEMPACSGKRPRALSLGQAAPAFALFVELAVLSFFIMVAERIHYRLGTSRSRRVRGDQIRPFVQ